MLEAVQLAVHILLHFLALLLELLIHSCFRIGWIKGKDTVRNGRLSDTQNPERVDVRLARIPSFDPISGQRKPLLLNGVSWTLLFFLAQPTHGAFLTVIKFFHHGPYPRKFLGDTA